MSPWKESNPQHMKRSQPCMSHRLPTFQGDKNLASCFSLLHGFTWNLGRILSLLTILKSNRKSVILASVIWMLHFTVKLRAFPKSQYSVCCCQVRTKSSIDLAPLQNALLFLSIWFLSTHVNSFIIWIFHLKFLRWYLSPPVVHIMAFVLCWTWGNAMRAAWLEDLFDRNFTSLLTTNEMPLQLTDRHFSRYIPDQWPPKDGNNTKLHSVEFLTTEMKSDPSN